MLDQFFQLISNTFVLGARFVVPALSILFLLLCVKGLFKFGKRPCVGRLVGTDGQLDYDITAAESTVGRSKICDVRINIGSVSRRGAVITYNEEYGFKITVTGSNEVFVNDVPVDGFAYLEMNDRIRIGGVEFRLLPGVSRDIESSRRVKKKPVGTALLLTAIQVIILLELLFHYQVDIAAQIPVVFLALIAGEWLYFLFRRFRGNIQIEMIGFYLTTFGLAVAASSLPESVLKQFVSAALGMIVFIISGLLFKNIDLTMKLRPFVAGGAVLLLLYNIFFGIQLNGAKNWIAIGTITIQPSELIKYAFIFVGAATLERLISKKNSLFFIGFSAICGGALCLMRDFGTALIYFATMLIILYMCSGDVKLIAGFTALAAVAAVVIIRFVPYVANRFSAYRHAWDFAADKGYQQTRTMMAIGSGGFFGMGAGEGNLDTVAAADTDLVFGILCEEFGLICALCVISCFVIFAIYALRCTPRTNSAFFSIAACATAGLFLVQISLNIFGSTDLLPLTGVTMPFVSNGGSSMVASWALLSFIKAVGDRTLKEETQ